MRKDIEVAYYLIHSMSSGEGDFTENKNYQQLILEML